MLAQDLLERIVCPACHGELQYKAAEQTLTCASCRRVYPIVNDIPILLVERATIPPA